MKVNSVLVQKDTRLVEQARVWGGTLLAMGLLLFTWTTISVMTKSMLFTFDSQTSSWLALYRSRTSSDLMNFIKVIGQFGSDGTLFFILAITGYSLLRKNMREFWLILISAGGGEIIWLLLVFVFQRPRPVPVSALGGLDLPSYPSGHAELVITVFGLLLYIFATGMKSRGVLIAFAIFVLVWAGLTGVIRLFLNVHHFTDVIGGYALGLAWVGIAILIVDGRRG